MTARDRAMARAWSQFCFKCLIVDNRQTKYGHTDIQTSYGQRTIALEIVIQIWTKYAKTEASDKKIGQYMDNNSKIATEHMHQAFPLQLQKISYIHTWTCVWYQIKM